jgi:hypothetical protein
LSPESITESADMKKMKKKARALRRGLGNNGDLETGVSIDPTHEVAKAFHFF